MNHYHEFQLHFVAECIKINTCTEAAPNYKPLKKEDKLQWHNIPVNRTIININRHTETEIQYLKQKKKVNYVVKIKIIKSRYLKLQKMI